MKTEKKTQVNVLLKEKISDTMQEVKKQMKEAVKDMLLYMISLQQQSEAQSMNNNNESKYNNKEEDDKNLSGEITRG